MTMLHLTLKAFLIFFLIATQPFRINSFSIKLIPIDRLDTMLFPINLTLEERYQKISEISRAHMGQLKSMVSSSAMDQKEAIEHNPDALQPKMDKGSLNYYVTSLHIGAHRHTANFVVDTGSSGTWVQCEGCSQCFPISQGNFDKSQSQSYHPIPCDHPLCVPHLCENNICMYNNRYLENQYSKGQLGSDTFFFNDKGGLKEYRKTVFGCGLENRNFAWEDLGQNNSIAGIFGLGLGKRSIFMQYVNETKRRLSYCLPSFFAEHTHTYLHFGDDAKIGRRHGIMTTRLIPNVTRYAVEVVDISIRGRRLHIDPALFRMRSDRTGGFILDSGCPYTFLVQPAYDIVKREIVDYFAQRYGWHPLPSDPEGLDLCYNRSRRYFTTPSMTFHFKGADLYLLQRNVFLFFDADFCWMVMPMDHSVRLNILGALQQANRRFLFDFTTHTVSFVPEVCGQSNFVSNV